MDENAILAECRAGKLERFAELYDGYVDRIYAFAYARTSHRPTAEDLTSQTFLRALESVSQFKSGSFQAWLYRIARNLVIDYYRASRRTENIEDQASLASKDHPELQAANRMQLEKAHDWLQRLPDERREIVQMRVWDQLPFREIAAIIGKSEASCKMSFSRTLREIRSALAAAILAGLILIPLYVVLN